MSSSSASPIPSGIATYYLKDLPVYVPSILKHYKKDVPSLLANLSPGNKAFADIDTSIVAVSGFIGVRRLVDCSGFIIDVDSDSDSDGDGDGDGEVTVLTSAKVVRYPHVLVERNLTDYFHVMVRLFNGEPLVAKLHFVDYHLNIAILKVRSTQTPLQAVDFAPHSPGHTVRVLGRRFPDLSLVKGDGDLCFYPPSIGCDDLITTTCVAPEICEGGPVIDHNDCVIGIHFIEMDGHAHLLPFQAFLHSVQSSDREILHIWTGFTAIHKDNLSNAARQMLNISLTDPLPHCMLVKQVFSSSSPAHEVGVCTGDQIIAFGGVLVDSQYKYLQLVNYELDASRNTTNATVQVDIRSRIKEEIIKVEARFIPVNDRRFCVLWPLCEGIWEGSPLFGSQTDSLLKWCYQPKKPRVTAK